MRTLAISLATLIAVSPVLAGGTLTNTTVPGPSLEGNLLDIPTTREVSVYLPPSYEAAPDRRYPTLYILHGIYDSNTTWTRPWNDEHPGYDTIQALMDTGIDGGSVREMIVVVPHCDEASHYTNSPTRGDWEDFVADDLVSFVDAHYRTVPTAEGRGITGHSMGGHGAIKLAMKHPTVFSVAYGLNPSLLGWGGDVSTENRAFLELDGVKRPEDLDGTGFYVHALVAVSQSFAPNPDVPLMTDLPFAVSDEGLAPAHPGFERWQSQMLIYMVPDYVESLSRLRSLRFDSAFEESFTHIPLTSRELSRVLTELGVEHTFEMYNGDHRSRLWGREGRLYTEVLPYFSRLLDVR